MIWTKQKALAESFLADQLKGRVKYHRTRYGPGVSYLMNRGWVTLDQKEILTCSTIKSVQDMHKLTGVWYSNNAQALQQLNLQGVFTLNDFDDAIHSILDKKIEYRLSSDNPLVRAFAFFDKRLGKRRLKEIYIPENEFAVVIGFYHIRCEAEGVSRGTT